MNLHVVALPHTQVSPEFCGCAYTNKIRLFVKMMKPHHRIFLYAPEGPPVDGCILVDCLSNNARLAIFGKDDPNRMPNWPSDQQTRLFNLMVTAKLFERVEQKEDLVLLSGGMTHAPIKNTLPHLMFCEPFVGYEGLLTDKCAFESYAHMHYLYGKRGITDIRWYDRVIPPFVDPDEFPRSKEPKGGYLLFVGRLIPRKGPHIALQIAQACDLPLVVAGAGGRQENLPGCQNRLIGQDVVLEGDVDYCGPVGIEERAKLMSEAIATLCPTTYIEPGANVVLESMMAGTPVIAPDCGVFSETIRHRLSGYHFRTLSQAVEGVQWAQNEQGGPDLIRAYADNRYSLKAIAPKFNAWFADLQNLWEKGWDTL